MLVLNDFVVVNMKRKILILLCVYRRSSSFFDNSINNRSGLRMGYFYLKKNKNKMIFYLT